jgi:hypothetical protein
LIGCERILLPPRKTKVFLNHLSSCFPLRSLESSFYKLFLLSLLSLRFILIYRSPVLLSFVAGCWGFPIRKKLQIFVILCGSDGSLEPGLRSDDERETREAAGDAKRRLPNNLTAFGEASWRRAVTWLHCLGEHDRSRSVQHRSFISDKSSSQIYRSP